MEVNMKKAKIFQNGQSQAVRLPKEFRFSGKEVLVQKFGNGILLLPTNKPWDTFKMSLDLFSDDFMTDRIQPEPQKREKFE